MKERPILFKGPMVRAIMEGRKTQTRRIVSKSNSFTGAGYPYDDLDLDQAWIDKGFKSADGVYRDQYLKAPVVRGVHADSEVVDRVYPRFTPVGHWDYEMTKEPDDPPDPACCLWVRETWHTDEPDMGLAKAEHEDMMSESPIYYRADPVNESAGCIWRPSIHMPRWACRLILEVTAVKVERLQEITAMDVFKEGIGSFASAHIDVAQEMFAQTWNQIHGEDAWHENPYVWVIEFHRVDSG